MRLPNPERAIADIGKIRDYVLNPGHRRGRHKARVFSAALGLTVHDADRLREALLDAALACEAIPGEHDEYGQRFVLEFEMSGPAGRAPE